MPNHEQDLNPMVEVQLHILKKIKFRFIFGTDYCVSKG